MELIDITKKFSQVQALNRVCMDVNAGEILGLIGENGAGKSTLMKILAGYEEMDNGQISKDGKVYKFQSPAEANRLGIGMLYQEPLDFTSLTALENFMLGGCFCKNKSLAKKKFLDLCRQFNFSISPRRKMGQLTVGERQQVEIIRLVSKDINVLILDEPTTGISASQRHKLFSAIQAYVSRGNSVILVSHKLSEVTELCHRIIVLRNGAIAAEEKRPFCRDNLLSLMFGKPPESPARKDNFHHGPENFAMRSIESSGERCGLKLDEIFFREGEIVGLAGLSGSGQGVFLRTAAGLASNAQGDIIFCGESVIGDYIKFKNLGGVFVPGNRLEEGMFKEMPVAEHVALCMSNIFLSQKNIIKKSKEILDAFQVKAEHYSPVHTLSGGNQQRLILSLIAKNPKFLLLEEPTRGLDAESSKWVWDRLLQHSGNGCTIIFSSSELEEILAVSHRVLVFFNGEIILDLPSDRFCLKTISMGMTGKIMQAA